MHIKEVIIEGFKSYKDQTRTEPFSSKINTVVGANGSGKSNFFQAIRFVLDADVPSLRQDERQKLLHEGTGHAVLSAYVEIVLDNSDGRMPIDKDEVRLRRTISVKKDEYRLNSKSTPKRDISSYLESAGFSKANPYYVVQQGKIMAMSTMKDEERLDLLKEIGGSKVYEDRRNESLKILHDAEARKRQISELVEDMEAKLRQLDAEKKELAEYQQHDRNRRSLEYAIYDKEVTDTRSKLQQIEEQRRQETERAGKAIEDRQAARAELKKTEKELRTVAAERKAAADALAEVAAQKQEAISRQARLELDVKELEEKSTADKLTQGQCKDQLKRLEKEIARAEKELKTAQASLKDQRATFDEMDEKVNAGQSRLQALETKQGLASSFATTKERDEWIRKEVKAKEGSRKQMQKQLDALKGQIPALETEVARLKEELAAKEGEVKALQQQTAEAGKALRQLDGRKNEAHNRRQEARRQEDSLKSKRNLLQEDLKRLERRVDPSGFMHQQALQLARKLSQEYSIPIHGTVLELVDCIEQLHTAVEVAAGGALFHLVLDDDAQVSRLLELLRRESRGGRVTCLPLNRLRVEPVTYPTDFGSDAVPLTDYLKCDARHKLAVQHVFGKWMVCKDSDVASRVIASTNQVNCVTIHGDVHAKKGTISGGFRDQTRNKLAAFREKTKVEKELQGIAAELQQLRTDLDGVDGEVNTVLGEVNQLMLRSEHDKKTIQRKQADVGTTKARLADLEHSLEAKRRAVSERQEALRQLADQITAVQADLGSAELGRLSPEEQREKQALQLELDRMKEERLQLQTALGEAEARFEEAEGALENNLRRRAAELREQMATADVAADQEELEARQQEAQAAEAQLRQLEEKHQEVKAQVDALAQQEEALKSRGEQLREAQKSDEQLAQAENNAVTTLLAKRGSLQQKAADLERKIKELGALPADAFEKHSKKALRQLQTELSRAQDALKRFGHVNKKALDQYVNFTEQRDELVRRHDETVRGKDKIRELIRTLDVRKDEAIERTFKGVAKHFREIFSELAPGGRGELVMLKGQRRELGGAVGGAEGDFGLASSTAGQYSGVKVKVSFGSGETMSMKQLSGGQKTLVALALIFSIQRLDPAPFYLFDEIDAALDPAHRTTVARVLAKQANDSQNPCQFIVTTFHPQIVHEADQVYGVSQSARVSGISRISKQAALEFVSAQEQAAAQEDA